MTDSRPAFIPARVASLAHALSGLRLLLATQPNARVHAWATALVVGAGWWCELSAGAWGLLVLAFVAVWSAEAFNTALELLTDLVSPEWHPLAGKAKDVAAAAVLLTALGAALVGLLVFGPYVLDAFN